MTRALFIADQFVDATRTADVSHPGGAELTDWAAIKACPWPIETARCTEVDLASLKDFDVIVVGNAQTASTELIRAIAATGRHISFEHDVRICAWRGNFPVAADPIHRFKGRCMCPHPNWSAFYDSSPGTLFLTHRQLRVFQQNPFYSSPKDVVLGSSLFNDAFFERVSKRSKGQPRSGVAVFGAKSKIKGFAQAQRYARKHFEDPVIIRNMEPEDVLDLYERVQTFIYHPMFLEPSGRMPVEARFLGCDVIVNDQVGVAGESWWHLEDSLALEVLRDAPHRFWRIIESLLS